MIVAGLNVGNVIRLTVFKDRKVPNIALKYMSIVPTIFIRCLLMVIVPFMVASLVTSLLLGDETLSKQTKTCVKSARQLITLTMLFFVSFLVVVSVFGISLVLILAPGRSSSIVEPDKLVVNDATLPEVRDQEKISGKY